MVMVMVMEKQSKKGVAALHCIAQEEETEKITKKNPSKPPYATTLSPFPN
jgi:hypothetical protein